MPTPNSIKAAPNSGATSEPSRIAAFARFFKSYMNLAAVVSASIPIPIAAGKLIPMYSAQRGFLTVYTSLLCFLLLAFIFSIRHRLAPLMFSTRKGSKLLAATPLLSIVFALLSILAYHLTLELSLTDLRNIGVHEPTNKLLTADYSEIRRSLALSAFYLGIFLFSELAFVLMALREYLQDVLHLDEVALLSGKIHLTEAVKQDALLTKAAIS